MTFLTDTQSPVKKTRKYIMHSDDQGNLRGIYDHWMICWVNYILLSNMSHIVTELLCKGQVIEIYVTILIKQWCIFSLKNNVYYSNQK